MMNQPCIHTDRLRLRPFSLSDAKDVQRMAGTASVADTAATIPHPYPDGMAETWIKSHRRAFLRQEQVVFAIALDAPAAPAPLVGCISLSGISRAHRHAELGYWIGREFWGQGYATEAAFAIARYGFSALQLHRIHARCLRRNPASARVMEKLGMHFEGCLRAHLLRNGAFEDILLYGLLNGEHNGASQASAASIPLL